VADGAIIAFIDDDAVAAPDWIAALRDSFSEPSILFVTGRVLPLELRTPAQRHFEERFSFDRGEKLIRFTATDQRPHFPIHPYHLGTGCNMAFRRQAFDLIGTFDEALDVGTPTGGGGDLDIFRRLLRAGYTAVYNPDALVWHQHREGKLDSYRQFWNYGKSLTALLVKSLLVERGQAREAWSATLHLPREWARRLARWLVRHDTIPLGLILVEILGAFFGPLAYLRSLRQVRRQWTDHAGPAQVR
jgi:GT2 family glycosyltransferase